MRMLSALLIATALSLSSALSISVEESQSVSSHPCSHPLCLKMASRFENSLFEDDPDDMDERTVTESESLDLRLFSIVSLISHQNALDYIERLKLALTANPKLFTDKGRIWKPLYDNLRNFSPDRDTEDRMFEILKEYDTKADEVIQIAFYLIAGVFPRRENETAEHRNQLRAQAEEMREGLLVETAENGDLWFASLRHIEAVESARMASLRHAEPVVSASNEHGDGAAELDSDFEEHKAEGGTGPHDYKGAARDEEDL